MRPVALSDEIAVGEIPSADEIAILARAGFRSLINVQPEGEVERLLSAADVAAGAEAAGMKYAHVPVASRRVPNDKVEAFAQAMISLPRPIYACCYSGARAAAAWALAVSSAMPPADIVANCSTAGFDMSALLPELEQRHRGTVAQRPLAHIQIPGDLAGRTKLLLDEWAKVDAFVAAGIAAPVR